jgi:DHA1 family bicyclomycin/chloramphenicol resistance-like MFS transporter
VKTRRQNFFLILMLGILNALTPFSIDMYLPAFSEIAHDLKTSVERVSFSVSTYFIGYALGQIFYGPLLDHFGRKRPLYAGLGIYVTASIGCMNVHSIAALLVLRFFQALGGSAASVGATAMVLDFFPAKDAAKVFSLLMLVLSVSPLLAPTIGSFVVVALGWRAVFAILAAIAASNIAMIYYLLPNEHVLDPDRSLKPRVILANFQSILRVREFTVYTLAGSFSFAGLFVYVAGSPAIFMEGFHLSAQAYGAVFAFLAVGMIGGGQLNLIFTRKFSHQQVFKIALIVQVTCAAIFFAGSFGQGFALPYTILFLFLILACSGITDPNAAALALSPLTKNIGSASALLGFLQLSLGSLMSAAVGFLAIPGTLPTAATMSISATLGLVILWFA